MYHKIRCLGMSLKEIEKNVKEWLERVLRDPLVNILLNKSSLTEIQ